MHAACLCSMLLLIALTLVLLLLLYLFALGDTACVSALCTMSIILFRERLCAQDIAVDSCLASSDVEEHVGIQHVVVQLREAVASPERVPKRLRIYVFNRHMHQPQPGQQPSAGA